MQKPLAEGYIGEAQPIHVRMPPATVDKLDALAELRGVRRSDLVREAVDRLVAEAAA